ncbi:hypothetical protein GA0070603_2898 [Micromonospora chersina]|uniref:RiboL-PSP-HEPN domain-containing protein n=1 Tax=Micromonospora chersina TaxID=47854 RepID=A0A1C6V0M7_9ACTN|nr:hypothetical protein GA0070603_2898 [Micromonospora chersina]
MVESLYDEYERIVHHLRDAQEISYLATLERTFPKVLLLASASQAESRICEAIIRYFKEVSGRHSLAVNFVKNKAISRQYHSFFDWDRRNANKFFGLFGEEFKARVVEVVRGDPTLDQAVRDFMELGSLRNQLVHQDYASFTIEKTVSEIVEQHRSAAVFVGKILELLLE